ncbi:MAG TPA: hypothetical protein VJB89_03660 [Candidatus Nanoarchaeia archaeon]|nr:hypothetical protein [Candidatus Nanoarchaeia archaeon]
MRGELIESNYKNLTREERGKLIAQKYKITQNKNGDYKVENITKKPTEVI